MPGTVSGTRIRQRPSPTPVSRLGLGPRPPPRPQPKWLLWTRRCSMISATKTESGAHHPGSTTSRAPRWLAIRRGLDRWGLPAVSSALPWPEPRLTPVRASHARAERPTSQLARSGAEADSRMLKHPARRCTPRRLPGLPATTRYSQGSPWEADHANGSATAESRGAFGRQKARAGCNSPRVALTHQRWTRDTHFFARSVIQP